MNFYTSGKLCLYCFRPHSNNAGSTCKWCHTSYSADPPKTNLKTYKYKKRPAKSIEQDLDDDDSEDFEVTGEEEDSADDE